MELKIQVPRVAVDDTAIRGIGTKIHEAMERMLIQGNAYLPRKDDMALILKTEDGKKRCLTVSSRLGMQCEKRRKHNKTDLNVVHQHGAIVWPDATNDELTMTSATWTSGQADPILPLDEWWRKVAGEEIELTVDKAREYGSTDLIDIGMMLARTMRRQVDEEEAAELGVFFYLIGKIARWQSAIERGERPSDDTIFDIGIYCRMAQRIRYAGGWPGEGYGEQP